MPSCATGFTVNNPTIKIEFLSFVSGWQTVCVTSNYDSLEAAMARYSGDTGVPADRVRASIV